MKKNTYSIMTNNVLDGSEYEYFGYKDRKQARKGLAILKKNFRGNAFLCICEEGVDNFSVCPSVLGDTSFVKAKYYIRRNY